MQIEFHYIRHISGFLAHHSTEAKMRKVLETGQFEVPEIGEADAPVAYREFFGSGTARETRWFNGSHWKIADDAVVGFDPARLELSMLDFRAIYEPISRDFETPLHSSRYHGFVEADKKWHRIVSDDKDEIFREFAEYAANNMAVIGGKFAYRVREPKIELFVERGVGDKPHVVRSALSGVRHTSSGGHGLRYIATFPEAESAAEDIVTFGNLDHEIVIAPLPKNYEVILPEAFSETCVEEASKLVLSDGLRVASSFENHVRDEGKTVHATISSMLQSIACSKGEPFDAEGMIMELAERAEAVRAVSPKGEWCERLATYLELDIPVTLRRLEAKRALRPQAAAAPTM